MTLKKNRFSNRDKAVRAGHTMYLGKPCRKGHQPPLRYTSYHGCVQCSLDRQPENMQPLRVRRNIPISDKLYLGSPCFRGHDGVRYKRNGNCVRCSQDDRYHVRAIRAALHDDNLDLLLG